MVASLFRTLRECASKEKFTGESWNDSSGVLEKIPQKYPVHGKQNGNSFPGRVPIHTEKTGGDGIGERYTFPSGESADTAFHTYGVVWTQNEMQFFVDYASSPFFTVTPSSLPSGDTWPFNQSIFTILNVAIGGTLGGSTSGLSNPQPMQVDYVRWYTPQ